MTSEEQREQDLAAAVEAGGHFRLTHKWEGPGTDEWQIWANLTHNYPVHYHSGLKTFGPVTPHQGGFVAPGYKVSDTVIDWEDVAEAVEAIQEATGVKANRLRTVGADYTIDVQPTPQPEIAHLTSYVLDRAKSKIMGDRARDYGDPTALYVGVARGWAGYLGLPDEKLDARDVLQLMEILKAHRDRVRRKDDTLDDQAGYAQVAAWVGDPRQGRSPKDMNLTMEVPEVTKEVMDVLRPEEAAE